MTHPFLSRLETEIDEQGQAIAERICPHIAEMIGAGVDDWAVEAVDERDRGEWQATLRSAILYKTFIHLGDELTKSASMHRDLVFMTLEREYEESADG